MFSKLAKSSIPGVSVIFLANQNVAQCSKPAKHRRIYWFGSRDAIPCGEPLDIRKPITCEWFEEHDHQWNLVSFAPSFGGALGSDGEIYVWGSYKVDAPIDRDKSLQTNLTIDDRSINIEERVYMSPTLLHCPQRSGVKFKDIQCSTNHIFGLSTNGEVYFFEDIPKFIEGTSKIPKAVRYAGLPRPSIMNGWKRIDSMSIGPHHYGFVSNHGDLLMSGYNGYGQCGFELDRTDDGFISPDVVAMNKVNFPNNVSIDKVGVGKSHTVAIDKNGKSWALGDDSKLQLCLGETRCQPDYALIQNSDSNDQEEKSTKSINPNVVYGYYERHLLSTPLETLKPPYNYRPEPYGASYGLATGGSFTCLSYFETPEQ
eukprot:GHVL01017615.1.p1 GENE.GHVL01017615.1~~GHVL01017615.1.p1  ORF type:complete len:371 (-),score=48.44 GHVL01017615.1:151-1263(-)